MTWTPAPGMTTRQMEKEVKRQAVLFEERVKNGQFMDANIRFADYADQWMSGYGEKYFAPKTLARYKTLLVRINAALGNIQLDRLQPHHIAEFLANLEEDDIRENTAMVAGRGKNVSKETAERICAALNLKFEDIFTAPEGKTKLSEKTILRHYRLISDILNAAVMDDRIILANPAARVRPPKCERQEAVYLDEKQAALLLELLEKEPMQYKTAITLLLYSGMRRGELLGLEWPDIDLDKRIVSIVRTSQYIARQGIITKEPKNETSTRVIKLSVSAIDLRQYRVWQNEQRLAIGDQWQPTQRLFTAWDGAPMHPDVLSGWFGDFIKRTDLPQIHVHSLRHTNATLMIAGGEDILTVSRRLGHAQASTTTNIYAHAIQSANAKAAETLENLLKPGAGKT